MVDASGGFVNSYGSMYYDTITGGVAVEVGLSGETLAALSTCAYVGMYSGDGSIYCSGLINPFNSVSTMALSAGVGSTVNTIFASDPYVFVTLKSASPGGSTIGSSYKYNIVASTLTVTAVNTSGATVSTDYSDVNWLAIGNGTCEL
jgi:hypothetical protein